MVRDVTEERAEAAHAGAERSGAAAAIARLEQRVESLIEANTRLLADNTELVQVSAELRKSNEALLAANDEVQVATEVVQTLNEELRSTKEELETLGEELRATIKQLNRTNGDMRARSRELQQLAKSLEEQQERTEVERARLAAAIGSQRDAILLVDATGHEIIRNEAWDQLAGVALEAADDPSLTVSLDALRDRVAAGERFEAQLRETATDGRRRWFEAYARPLLVDGESRAGGILVIHDTTDLSLRRLQEEFVAIVAHELRTPLTALRGYLQMLGRPGTDPETSRVLAVEQADRLARLIDELFDVARAETGALTIERRKVSLRELVAQTVEIGGSLSERHRISLEMDDDDLVVHGDPARLQQVILNLIANAIVHAPTAPEIAVRLRGLRRRAEIEVEDHGPGIPPERRRTIFARFQRGDGSPGGLGLGLYISREIVTAHGGTIEVDSEPGESTTFTVRLPLASGIVRRDATGPREPSRGERILTETAGDP